jgi:hypothetical protein
MLPEEQDVHAHHDGYKREHIGHYDDVSHLPGSSLLPVVVIVVVVASSRPLCRRQVTVFVLTLLRGAT